MIVFLEILRCEIRLKGRWFLDGPQIQKDWKRTETQNHPKPLEPEVLARPMARRPPTAQPAPSFKATAEQLSGASLKEKRWDKRLAVVRISSIFNLRQLKCSHNAFLQVRHFNAGKLAVFELKAPGHKREDINVSIISPEKRPHIPYKVI